MTPCRFPLNDADGYPIPEKAGKNGFNSKLIVEL